MTPCGSCRRHVVTSDAVCPFCGAAVTPAPSRPVIAVRRLTRSAVFAGASLASGCWTDRAPATTAPPATQEHTDKSRPSSSSSTGTIHGTVTDTSGQPVAEIWIQITPNPYHAEDHDRNKDVSTDAHGAYTIDMPPGDYRVAVLNTDPRQPRPERLLILQAGQSATADFKITVAPTPPMPMPYGAPPARRRVV